jgi:hypothetical protein
LSFKAIGVPKHTLQDDTEPVALGRSRLGKSPVRGEGVGGVFGVFAGVAAAVVEVGVG